MINTFSLFCLLNQMGFYYTPSLLSLRIKAMLKWFHWKVSELQCLYLIIEIAVVLADLSIQKNKIKLKNNHLEFPAVVVVFKLHIFHWTSTLIYLYSWAVSWCDVDSSTTTSCCVMHSMLIGIITQSEVRLYGTYRFINVYWT